MKKVLVACGTGGVTSKNIAMKIEAYLKQNGIDCIADTCKVIEVRSKAESFKPDLIASATKVPETGIPTVTATSLLTGIGTDKIYKEIMDILSK